MPPFERYFRSMPPPPSLKESLTTFLVLSLSIVLTILIYWPGLYGPFLLDDAASINTIKFDEFSLQSIINLMLSNGTGPLGRPVSTLSLALNYFASGLSTWAFKYTNLMLHLITGLLLFWFSLRIIPLLSRSMTSRRVVLASVAASTIWLLHPLNVSTVLYAVQRMAILSSLFTVAAMLAYTVGRQRIHNGRPHGLLMICLAVPTLSAIAVLSKENGALVPFFLLAIEFIAFQRTANRENRQQIAVAILVTAAIPLIVGTAYLLTHTDTFLSGYLSRSFSIEERLLTQTKVIWFYLWLIILPRVSSMTLFHDDFPISSYFDPLTTAASLGIIGLILSIFIFRRRSPWLSFGLAFFLSSHLMESTFLPLEIAFEHRNYLGMFGIILSASILLFSPRRKFDQLRLVIPTSIFIILLLSIFSHIRIKGWDTRMTYASIAIQEHPNSLRANSEYANLMGAIVGDIEAAKSVLRHAMQIAPNNAGPRLHFLLVSCGDENFLPEIVSEANTLLRTGYITPYSISGLNSLQVRFNDRECDPLSPTQLQTLLASVRTNPGLIDGHKGLIASLQARVYVIAGKFEEAAAAFDEAFILARSLPPGRRADPLLEKLEFEVVIGFPERAAETLVRLREFDRETLADFSQDIDSLEELLIKHPSGYAPHNNVD